MRAKCAAAVLLAMLISSASLPMAGAATKVPKPPKPKINAISIAPATVTTAGGTGMLQLKVANVKTCTVSSTPATLTGSGQYDCSNGALRLEMTFPPNKGKKPVKYKFTVVASQRAQGSSSIHGNVIPAVPDVMKRITESVTPKSGGFPVLIAAGDQHNCVSMGDGTASCWGANDRGQLGDGSTTDRLTPVPVSGLSDAVRVIAGGDHSCALRSDQTVSCWGANDHGELGDGSTTDRLTPVPVSGLWGVVQVTLGYDHSCALRFDQSVWCWGANDRGQLGDGSTNPSPIPVAVATMDGNSPGTYKDGTPLPYLGPTTIATGNQDSCAIRDGSLLCWGDNSRGQLGQSPSSSQMQVRPGGTNIPPVLTVALGNHVTCVIEASQFSALGYPMGRFGCMGANDRGQLFDGTTTDSSSLVGFTTDEHMNQISVGGDFTCIQGWIMGGMQPQSASLCTGGNDHEQLGSDIAPIMLWASGTSFQAGKWVGTPGGSHQCTLSFFATPSMGIRCWGAGGRGQLGDGLSNDSASMVDVLDASGSPFGFPAQ